jgi:hypothetical protein
VYSSFQPELIKERAARESLDMKDLAAQHTTPEERALHLQQAADAERDTVISRAMASDFREAGEELRKAGGFAWGIRKAIFGGVGRGVEQRGTAEKSEDLTKPDK